MLKGREPLDLYLDNSKVKGHGVGALSDWPIHSINLNFSSVTDAGMKDICKIRTLRKVSLNMTDLSDKGIMELANLKNLDTLRLGSCPKITNKGIIHILKNCKRLTALNIGYSKRLTADLIPVISSCPDLVRIELQGLGVNDKQVEMLCKNKAIIKLRLTYNPALTDKSVEQLAKLPRLGSMSVSGCDNVSETAIERFRKLHPHCEIVKEFKKKKERKVEDFVSDLLQAELGS